MFAVLYALGMFIADLFKSRSRLEAEILFLRHQLNICMRRRPTGSTARNRSGFDGLDGSVLAVAT